MKMSFKGLSDSAHWSENLAHTLAAGGRTSLLLTCAEGDVPRRLLNASPKLIMLQLLVTLSKVYTDMYLIYKRLQECIVLEICLRRCVAIGGWMIVFARTSTFWNRNTTEEEQMQKQPKFATWWQVHRHNYTCSTPKLQIEPEKSPFWSCEFRCWAKCWLTVLN